MNNDTDTGYEFAAKVRDSVGSIGKNTSTHRINNSASGYTRAIHESLYFLVLIKADVVVFHVRASRK